MADTTKKRVTLSDEKAKLLKGLKKDADGNLVIENAKLKELLSEDALKDVEDLAAVRVAVDW